MQHMRCRSHPLSEKCPELTTVYEVLICDTRAQNPLLPRYKPFRVRMGTGSGQPIPRVIPLKNKKCAKGIPLNCGKGLKPRVGHGVTCTSICLVLRSFTVENQLAELLFLPRASLLCCNKL